MTVDAGAPLVSLSHGSVLDAAPAAVLRAASTSGYRACSLRLDPDVVDPSEASVLRRVADDLGVVVLDVEVARLGAGTPDHHARLVDLTALLGARHLLTVSHHADESEAVDAVGRLAVRAHDAGVRVALEFMAFTSVRDLAQGRRVAEATGAGLVVDALHLDRCGDRPDDVAALPAGLVAYLQLCDAPAERPRTPTGLAHEARHDRLPPGEGVLPLTELSGTVAPEVPRCVEVQSDDLAARLGVDERAALLLERVRPFLPGGAGV